jgi:predicted RNA-binding Zn ribbon-like protein
MRTSGMPGSPSNRLRAASTRTDQSMGALALALANTRATNRAPDRLSSPAAAVEWLISAGILSDDGPPDPALSDARRLMDECRRLRCAILQLLSSLAGEQGPIPTEACTTIERTVTAGVWVRSVQQSPDGLRIAESPVGTSDPRSVLAGVAVDAVSLGANADPRRLRRCAAEDCGRWFLDTSRGGQRRWCSMATCGNRSKATRHRERQPEAPFGA